MEHSKEQLSIDTLEFSLRDTYHYDQSFFKGTLPSASQADYCVNLRALENDEKRDV